MSVIAIMLYIFFAAYLITRFGNQVLARDSTSWWFILVFMGIGIVYPEAYQYISQSLGIIVVSNFVFAALILFLVKVTLEGAIRNTQILRKMRDIVTTEAARKYVEVSQFKGREGAQRVLIMLPTYNEAANLDHMARELGPALDALMGNWQWTLCFVNDGSRDGTGAYLRRVFPYQHVSHPSNLGVAGVLMTGFKAAVELGCEYVVQCDADCQHPARRIGDLLKHAVETQADLVIGSRFFRGDGVGGQSYRASTTWGRRMGGRLISLGLWSFGQSAAASDPTSGFRVYSQKAAQFLVQSMPDDYPEPESIALCAIRGLRVSEVTVEMNPRQGRESSISGRKSIEFMIKVFTALISLRIRCFISAGRIGA